MSKTQLRVAKTSEKEIDSLFAILNEAGSLKKELEHNFLEDIDFSEFEIMKSFNRENEEGFLTDFVRHLSSIHFQRILFNCQTLLDNCADPDSDTLDFNKDIKRGLVLLNAQKQEPDFDNQAKEYEFARFKSENASLKNAIQEIIGLCQDDDGSACAALDAMDNIYYIRRTATMAIEGITEQDIADTLPDEPIFK